jgi:hypothetical protein
MSGALVVFEALSDEQATEASEATASEEKAKIDVRMRVMGGLRAFLRGRDRRR